MTYKELQKAYEAAMKNAPSLNLKKQILKKKTLI